ncbi:MAG: hypothetical protein Q4F13_08145 [Pseudomonadota bacterium]|nr:hypothetical protein [Pseudomonadota bacterium]
MCAGILLGCAVLATAALQGSGLPMRAAHAWAGLAATALAGAGAVFITVVPKPLLDRRWQPGAVLTHRFYLLAPLAGSLAWAGGAPATALTPGRWPA